MPFSGLEGGRARIRLEQIDVKLFRLLEGFRYVSASTGAVFEVTPEVLTETDLTSVPAGFRWFVNPYGRQTLPAMLHDCLIDSGRAQRATVTPGLGRGVPDREEADDLFLEALHDRGVPRIRRFLMWASVTFVTRFRHAGSRVRAGMVMWSLAAAAGTWLVFSGWVTSSWAWVLAGVLAPLPFSVLWGRSWFAAVCFGYGVVFLLPSTIVVHVSYALYWAAEKLLEQVGVSTPPPDFDKF